jgi:hypothetical protein
MKDIKAMIEMLHVRGCNTQRIFLEYLLIQIIVRFDADKMRISRVKNPRKYSTK